MRTRINRKKKCAYIIENCIGKDVEFNVYDVEKHWRARWTRIPTIKELSKTLPAFIALERYRVNPQSYMMYIWHGDVIYTEPEEDDEDA